MIRGQHDKAVEEGRRSITLGPNNAEVHTLFGQVLMFSGNFSESVEMCEKAIRLHPHAPLYYFSHLMRAYRWVGQYDESLAIAEKLIESGVSGRMASAYSASAITYIKLGRESDARERVALLLKIDPKANLDDIRKSQPYKDPAHIEEVLDALRKAGVPEHPS